MEILIPPIEHTYKSITYTCTGEGLYKEGYHYDAHPEKFFPPKVPKHLKPPPTEPKEVEKKPVAYWKAQCAFRGLNQSGAISDLQLRIREAKKKMLPELKMAETELNREFKKKNKAAKDATAKNGWNSLQTVEAKAKANPQKFLTEAFPKGATGRPANLDIVLVKIDNPYRLALADAAEAMSLETVTVDAPWTGKKRPIPDRWVIVGRSRDAVWDQMRQIERETARSKQNLPKEKSQASTPAKKNVPKEKALAPAKAAKPKVVKKTASESLDLPSSSSSGPTRTKQTARPCKETLEKWAARNAAGLYVPDPVWPPKQQEPPPPEPSSSASPRKKQTAIRSKTTPGPIYVPKREPEVDIKPSGFDATGFFKISCPEIDEQWGDSSLTLEIHIRTSNGRTQMFGLFDFNVIQGIMRFEKPVPVPKSKSEPDSKKRKWETDEEDDDGYIDMEDYPDFETEPSHYSNSVFNLGAKDKPTARRPTWQYRWRGRETGEGEIQLYSDKQIQSITFSKKGDQLSGTLKNDLLDCKFTGTKIRSTSPTAVNPDSEWDIYSERYGMSAKVFHIPFILSSPQFNLYSIVQRSPKPNDNASQDHPSATIYSAPDSLYADPVVDVVIISTTPETHFQFTKAALEAGKHVIVEKPFVPTSSQASALIEIAKEKGKLICVFQNRRWDSDFLAVRGLINNGEFGRIVEFETHYDRFRPTRPETWKGTLGMENAGGVLYDLGSHLIDQVYVLFGIPKNVFAVFRNERRDGHDPDTITVLMDYENGPLVTVKVAILSVEKEQLRFWVRGSKASFKKFGMDSQEEQLKAGLKPGDEGFGVETEERAGRLSVFTEGSEVQERKVWNATPLTYGALYAAFAKAIKGEGETAVPVKASEARDVLKIIEAARESVKTGRRVEL